MLQIATAQETINFATKGRKQWSRWRVIYEMQEYVLQDSLWLIAYLLIKLCFFLRRLQFKSILQKPTKHVQWSLVFCCSALHTFNVSFSHFTLLHAEVKHVLSFAASPCLISLASDNVYYLEIVVVLLSTVWVIIFVAFFANSWHITAFPLPISLYSACTFWKHCRFVSHYYYFISVIFLYIFIILFPVACLIKILIRWLS